MINDELEKRIRLAGKRAREEARKHGTYVVYEDDDGNIVREYPDGTIVRNDENE
jgi:hypothetical protein